MSGILKINCNAQVSERNTYDTWLLFNPYDTEKTVTYTLPDGNFDLFNSVKKEVIASGVSGTAEVTLAAGEAVVIIELAAGSRVEHTGTNYFVDGNWIAADAASVHIGNHANNDTVSGTVKLDLECVSTNPEGEVDRILLTIDGVVTEFTGADKVSFQTKDYGSGSKTVLIELYMQDGTCDKTDIRLRFE